MSNQLSSPVICLSLAVESDQISFFSPLLQNGVRVKIQRGSSIKTMLCQQFGLSPGYVETRLQTVFLNGKTVDDLDKAILEEGSILALSAAMPGLAGATLRKGSYLASLRRELTYPERKASSFQKQGTVVVKLFNLLINELGPIFLKQGIYIAREDFAAFWEKLPEDFRQKVKGVQIAGKESNLNDFLERKWPDRDKMEIMLKVIHLS